jgi:hypothetical protein
VQLLVAMKQGKAGIAGHEIDLSLLISTQHHNIFDHA